MSGAEAGEDRQMKAVPAPIPVELFLLSHTIQSMGQSLIVYVCRLDGSFVPEQGRELHRKWHEDLARMIRDAGTP
jgi:hypothetical protein